MAADSKMVFTYKARNFGGQEVVGKQEASNMADLTIQLKEQGLILIKGKKEKKKAAPIVLFEGKVPLKELIPFTHQMRILYAAGVPILAGLEDIKDVSKNPSMQRAIGNVCQTLKNGSSLSEAMSQHPKAFDKLYCGITQVGEATGKLDVALERLAHYLEKRLETGNRIKSAMIYPTMLCSAIGALVLLLLTVVLPSIMELFTNNNAVLPVPTQIVMFLSDWLTGNWPLLLIFMIASIICLVVGRRIPRTRHMMDFLMTKLPIFGTLVVKDAASAFSNTLATLYKSGINISDALVHCEEVVGNTYIKNGIHRARLAVEEGGALFESLRDTGTMPPLVISMIKVGEESGNLNETLEMVCKFYDEEIPRAIKTFMGLLEPTIIVVAGGLVAFIILATLLPIYTLMQSMA